MLVSLYSVIMYNMYLNIKNWLWVLIYHLILTVHHTQLLCRITILDTYSKHCRVITVMDINRYTINQWLATYQQVTNHKLLVSLLSATVKSMRAGNYYSILFIIHSEKLSLFHTYLHSPKKHLWLAALPAFTVFTT